MSAGVRLFLFTALALPFLSSCFYLPGVSPTNWVKLDKISVKAEQLSSARTHLPYEYFWLPFCEPADEHIEHQALNLGEVLAGQRIYNSGYKLIVMSDQRCKILCRKKLSAAQVKEFAVMIKEEYRVNVVADNLPVGVISSSQQDALGEEDAPGKEKIVNFYEMGYPVGSVVEQDIHPNLEEWEKETLRAMPPKIILNNHLSFQVSVFQDPSAFDGFRIVGFEVTPSSVRHTIQGRWNDFKCRDVLSGSIDDCTVESCESAQPLELDVDNLDENGMEIVFSYDVMWQKSDVQWASRWDAYLRVQDEEVHWIVIVNSFMVVLFLSGLIASILVRSLKNDLKRYQEFDLEQDGDGAEETGWKLIHADVFRPPAGARFFAILIGSGLQVGSMLILREFRGASRFLIPCQPRRPPFHHCCALCAYGYHRRLPRRTIHQGFCQRRTVFRPERLRSQWRSSSPELRFPHFSSSACLYGPHIQSGAVPFSAISPAACLGSVSPALCVLVGARFGIGKGGLSSIP